LISAAAALRLISVAALPPISAAAKLSLINAPALPPISAAAISRVGV
jgi:hypothetical protein